MDWLDDYGVCSNKLFPSSTYCNIKEHSIIEVDFNDDLTSSPKAGKLAIQKYCHTHGNYSISNEVKWNTTQ